MFSWFKMFPFWAKIFFLAALILGIWCEIYRYRHPEKTETQIKMDLMTGKIFSLEK